MSSKTRLFPLSSTENSWQLPIQGAWGSVSAEPQDMQFLRSWLVYDSEVLNDLYQPADWRKLLGLAMSVAVSTGIWIGVGLTIARLLR